MDKLFVVFLFLLVGCGAKENANEVQLFNGYALTLNTGEYVAPIDEVVNKRYLEAQKNSNFQAPLFRYISHPDYDMFVGIPYNTSYDDISAYYGQQAKTENTLFECDNAQCCLIEQNNSCQCVFKRDNNSLVFLIIKSKKESLSHGLIQASALGARLVKH